MEIKNEPIIYSGKIVDVGERTEYGTNGFAKRSVVISPDPDAKYPKCLQVFLTTGKTEDRTSLITQDNIGRMVKVSAYVESRKWTSKSTGKEGYITEATAFKVEWLEYGEEPPAPEPVMIDDTPFDDMPF